VLLPDDTPDRPAPDASTRPPLRRGCYVVFDLETTVSRAGAAGTDILQIAARRFIDGQQQEPWATFVRPPDGHVPARITRLTNITPEQVRDAPDAASALRSFVEYVGDLPLVAHNGASFDGPVLAAVAQRVGVPLPPFQVLDTLPLARVLLPLLPAHRVGSLAGFVDCWRAGARQADVDGEMLCGIVAGLGRLLHEGPPAGPYGSCCAVPATRGPSCSDRRRASRPTIWPRPSSAPSPRRSR
jgi:DNA polymerase III alpha subunit (gram-positive type)